MNLDEIAGMLRGGPVNVGDTERVLSALGGAVLLGAGLRRGSLPGLLLGVAGGMLAHRGLTGHCMAYAATGTSTAGEVRPPTFAGQSTAGSLQVDEDDDLATAVGLPHAHAAGADVLDPVDEASDESFPASDAPSFTP